MSSRHSEMTFGADASRAGTYRGYRRPPLHRGADVSGVPARIAAFLLAAASAAAAASPQSADPAVVPGGSPPLLSGSTALATAGYFQLRWRPAAGTAAGRNFELEQRGGGELRHWRIDNYRRFEVSGLGNGEYEYRVRRLYATAGVDSASGASAWSEPVRVTVEHHNLARALGLFALGLTIFASLVGIVLARRRQ